MINDLIERGVRIPAPESVVLENVDPERILPGAVIYPGSIIRGRTTWIGRNARIGEGGGALVENAQIGENCRIMQGTYRDCTLLDGVVVRNGAEIREGSLLEEGVDIGHTVGLKQTIFFPNVVAGSLINFCDVLMAGGTSRKVHSEIGSCLALYNYTPQGDKFASIFGDVVHGVFLNQKPIFVGGQTQIVNPVRVGFGAVIGAGSRITKNVEADTIVCTAGRDFESEFEPTAVHRPDVKIENTQYYLEQLLYLKMWYQNVRLPLYAGSEKVDEKVDEKVELMRCALGRVESGISERSKRVAKFVEKLPASLSYHRAKGHEKEIVSHERAMELAQNPVKVNDDGCFPVQKTLSGPVKMVPMSEIAEKLRMVMNTGKMYTEAVSEYVRNC